MPHICIVTTVHAAYDTRVFHHQARTLAHAGYRVTLLAQGATPVFRDGVQVLPLPPRTLALPRRARHVWTAWRRAIALNADAYHLHDPELTPLVPLFKWRGRRVVVDVHEHVPLQVMHKPYIPAWQRRPLARLYDAWERVITRPADAVITVVPEIAARFGTRDGQPRAVLVQNRPELARFTPADPATSGPDGTVTAIYVGLIENPRGLRELARAIRLVPAEVPLRVRFVGPCRFPAFQDELRQLGGERLSVEAAVAYEDVPRLLAESHIGLVTLLPTPQYVISQPSKMFEYMAAGLPVLRSDFPVWNAFATEGSLTVDPTDERAIAAALTRLATDPALRARLGAAGRRVVQARYSWTIEAEKLLAVYNGLIGPPDG